MEKAQDSELKAKTAKGLLWGGVGSVVQQVLSLCFGIVLARLLSPSDYGMVGVLAIFTALANSLQEGGLKSALINRRQIDRRDYDAVFCFNTGVSILLYAILFLSAPWIADFFHNEDLVPLSRVVFLGFVFTGLGTAHLGYLSKTFMVREQALSNIIAAVISGFVGIMMAIKDFGYWSLAVQSVSFPAVRTVCLWLLSPWRPRLTTRMSPVFEMFRFSLRLVITSIFSIMGNNYFSVLFGRYYSKQDVGYYTQANKWNSMCYLMVNGMVNSVSQPLFSTVESDAQRQLRALRKMIRFTSFVSFPAMFGLALIAPEFITLTITDKWIPCVSMLQIFCLWGAFYPIMSVMSALVLSKRKSSAYMWTNISLSIVLILVLVCLRRQSIIFMVTMFVAVNIMWVFVWHYHIRKAIGYRVSSFVADIVPFLLISLAVMAVTFFITRTISVMWLLMASRIVIAASLYILVMHLFRMEAFTDAIFFVKEKFMRK